MLTPPDFEEFVAARGPRLLRVAWLLTGDAHLAEDLLQTVLAKAWPQWHRIADGSPEAYLRKALTRSTVILYERTDAGWTAGAAWPAHNALKGWTDDHREGDLRSPVGVFTLTDAGGRLADPGTARHPVVVMGDAAALSR
nr:sigma factor [Streptomyces sp. RKAG337]